MYISILIRIRVYIYPHSFTRSVTIRRPHTFLRFGRYSYIFIYLYSIVYVYTYTLVHTLDLLRFVGLLFCYNLADIHIHVYIYSHSYTSIHIYSFTPDLLRFVGLTHCYDLADIHIHVYMYTHSYTCIHIQPFIYKICHDLHASCIVMILGIFVCMHTPALIHIHIHSFVFKICHNWHGSYLVMIWKIRYLYTCTLVYIHVYIYPHAYTRSVTICMLHTLVRVERYSCVYMCTSTPCIHVHSFIYKICHSWHASYFVTISVWIHVSVEVYVYMNLYTCINLHHVYMYTHSYTRYATVGTPWTNEYTCIHGYKDLPNRNYVWGLHIVTDLVNEWVYMYTRIRMSIDIYMNMNISQIVTMYEAYTLCMNAHTLSLSGCEFIWG